MSNYDLVVARAKAFQGDTYAGLLSEIAEFAGESSHRVILSVNIETNPDDDTLTAYVMYEG